MVKLSWNHTATLAMPTALKHLAGLALTWSADLDPERVKLLADRLFSVWIQPAGAQPVRLASGVADLSAPQVLAWRSAEAPTQLRRDLGGGGLVVIQLHADHLLDREQRPVSGSALGLLGIDAVLPPGGTFTAWLRVAGPNG